VNRDVAGTSQDFKVGSRADLQGLFESALLGRNGQCGQHQKTKGNR
jgi:hypothetical protein